MKKIIIMLVAAAFVTISLVAYASKMPTEVQYETKFGVVTFDHTAHKSRGESCKTCHHTGTYESCKTCHDGEKAPAAKTVYHKVCIDCHKTDAVALNDKKCTGCHIK
jgi:hypothetical protein